MGFFRVVTCICILGLLVSGCQHTQQTPPQGAAATTSAPTIPQTIGTTQPGFIDLPGQLSLKNEGKLRISYNGNRSSVQYITDPAQLPDHEVFSSYNAAFFENNALLLVTDTVGSGSTQISIDSVIIDGNTASVTLLRTMPADVGTTDMATWLLWAEVPGGLELHWQVANPVFENSLDLQTK